MRQEGPLDLHCEFELAFKAASLLWAEMLQANTRLEVHLEKVVIYGLVADFASTECVLLGALESGVECRNLGQSF